MDIHGGGGYPRGGRVSQNWPKEKSFQIFFASVLSHSLGLWDTQKKIELIGLILRSHQTTCFLARKYKGFTKSIKRKFSLWYFKCLCFKKTFAMTFILPAWLTGSIPFFRPPYQLCHLFDMSSDIRVICHLWHWWQMTDDEDDRWQSQYGCLKKCLDLTSQAGGMKIIRNFYKSRKIEKYHSKSFSFIDFVNPLYFWARKQVVWWDLNISPIDLKFFLV